MRACDAPAMPTQTHHHRRPATPRESGAHKPYMRSADAGARVTFTGDGRRVHVCEREMTTHTHTLAQRHAGRTRNPVWSACVIEQRAWAHFN